jgi:hypothetical protein
MWNIPCKNHEDIQGEQSYTDYSYLQRPTEMSGYHAPAVFTLENNYGIH